VKLTVSVRLLPDAEQAAVLRATLERCNGACDWLAGLAHGTGTRRQYDLHRLAYAELRVRFGLAAQVAVRCIAKVADSLKAGAAATRRSFRRQAAHPFDGRIFRFLPGQDAVSIWTLAGRQRVPFACGERQRALLARAKGEVDLMFVRGKWMLAATCDADEAPAFAPSDVLGVDLGVVNLAVDSNGTVFSGAQVERARRRHHARRRALQRKGTRSAKRALRRASGRQARFQRHTNHCIAKAIVAVAERDRLAIALEDLEGIRDRVQAPRRQRARLHNWAFHQERTLIGYKAALRGVPIVLTDPRNSSRECPACGLIDKRNRPDRDSFRCVACGLAGPSDHIAAMNHRQRGRVARGLVVPPQGSTAPAGAGDSPVRSEESRLL
jgi:putative transposase